MAVPLTDSILNIIRHDFASGQWSPVTRRWLAQLAGEPTALTTGARVAATEAGAQPLTLTPARLWAPVLLSTDLMTVLRATATVILDTVTALNLGDSMCTLDVHVVPAGEEATEENTVAAAVLLGAGASYYFPELVGHVLEEGESVQMRASAEAVVTTRGSGRIVTGG